MGQLRIAANDRAFVLRDSPTDPQHAILEVNLVTGAQRIRSDAGSAHAISRSLDQTVLTVTGDGCVERYDAATDTFGPCTTTSPSGDPSVDRTGQHFAIQRTAFDASFTPIGTVQTPWDLGNSLPTMISADGTYIFYYYAPTGVVRARVSDGAIMDRTRVPQFPSTGFFMSLSPDGTTMLLGWDDGTQGGTSHIATVDLRDANAQPLQVARLSTPLPFPPLRPTRIAPPTATRPLPWHARPAAPRPWRAAATTGSRNPGR